MSKLSELLQRQADQLERWPQLATLPRSDWDKAAEHLDAAAAARVEGKPCPVCPPE